MPGLIEVLRRAACAACLLAASGAASAAPLPPRRSNPAAVAPAPVAQAPAAPASASPAPADPAPAGECGRRLAAIGILADPAPQPAAGACVIEEPVRLAALPLPGRDRRRLDLPDRPVVACSMAERFSAWATGIAAPVLGAARGAAVTAIRTGPGFECRGRNRQEGAKLSAHGLGLALDVAGFDFADGYRLSVRAADPPGPADDALAVIRTAACGWFTTVLGPGSDAFHADHLHLDIQLHGASDRYRICQ